MWNDHNNCIFLFIANLTFLGYEAIVLKCKIGCQRSSISPYERRVKIYENAMVYSCYCSNCGKVKNLTSTSMVSLWKFACRLLQDYYRKEMSPPTKTTHMQLQALTYPPAIYHYQKTRLFYGYYDGQPQVGVFWVYPSRYEYTCARRIKVSRSWME